MQTLDKKTDRVVAKARFSCWIFMREVIIALILGGAIGAVWYFNDVIENFILKHGSEAIYLTDQNMRWAMLTAGILVLLSIVIEAVQLASKKLFITEDRLVYHLGIFSVRTASIPLTAIKSVETKQNALQAILGYGSVVIVSDAEKPYVVKGVVKAERLARRIMKQLESTRAAHQQSQLVTIRLAGPPMGM